MGQHRLRPVFLSLSQLHYPWTALVSIAHRLSGLFMAIIIPFLVWMLYQSLHSEASFNQLKQSIETCFYMRFLIWSFSCAFLYHLYAGIRHLFMDLHFFETKKQGQYSAVVVIIVFFIAALAYSFYFWRGYL